MSRDPVRWLPSLVERADERHFHHHVVLAVVLGVGVGLVATAFRAVWLAAKHHLWSALTAPYWRPVVSTAAGLLIGVVLTASFYPGALSALVDRFHREGRVPIADNLPAIPVGLVGLLAGQNAGPEGVMSVVGGSLGTALADLVDFENATKLLTLAGMGAGFGTILGAPIGGALLWLELPHERGLEYYEAIVPTFVASFAGYLTEVAVGGMAFFPAWRASSVTPVVPAQLVAAVGVGAACIPCAFAYTNLFSLVGRAFDRWSPRVLVRTTAAGLGIGLLGWLLPLTYFYGGAKMNALLSGTFTLPVLALTLAGTMLAAAITIHGNWLGGLIVPHMFMGALVGRAAALLVPGLAPTFGMMAGMAAFNAAVTGTPLSSAIIAIALTDGASITPIFLASLAAFVASPGLRFLASAAPRSEPPAFYTNLDD